MTIIRSLALLALLTGCVEHDPYVRQGEWRPLGANATNLRAMVADPSDLYAGRGASGTDGQLAAVAVARVRADKVKKLPASGVAEIKVGDPGGDLGSLATPSPGAGGAAAP